MNTTTTNSTVPKMSCDWWSKGSKRWKGGVRVPTVVFFDMFSFIYHKKIVWEKGRVASVQVQRLAGKRGGKNGSTK